MKKITLFLVLVSLFFQCNKKADSNADFSIPSAELKSEASEQTLSLANNKDKAPKLSSTDQSSVVPATDKKIIRNAKLRFQVKSHNDSSPTIEKIVKDMGAYIGSSSEEHNSYSLQTNMTIRVAGNKFDQLVNALLKEAFFINQKNITAEDVTAQFVDTEARLKTKREVEKRYLDILKQAKSIEEILQVENQLGVIREEIEAKEGLLKLLNDQVSYSTITLEFYESIDYEPQPEEGFFSKIFKGIKTGWDGLLSLIVGVFYVWPFILLIWALIYLIRKWRKNRKKN